MILWHPKNNANGSPHGLKHPWDRYQRGGEYRKEGSARELGKGTEIT